jgi:hypothetical protein
MRRIFLTTKLSVVDLSAFQGMEEAIEIMWRSSDSWMARLPLWEEEKAMAIATRMEAEATTEDEAMAIFEEMS